MGDSADKAIERYEADLASPRGIFPLMRRASRHPDLFNNLFKLGMINVMLWYDIAKQIYYATGKHQAKPFSSGTVAKVNGSRSGFHMKSYQHIPAVRKKLWDNSPFDRFVFYDMGYHKRRGYFAQNIVKCTKWADGQGITYAFSPEDENGDDWVFFLTSHVFERIAERRGLQRDQFDLLDLLFREWKSGLMVADVGDEDMNSILFANDGLYLSYGYSVSLDGSGPLMMKHSSKCIRYVQCKTFVTNDMVRPDQILLAEKAERVKFKAQSQLDGLDEGYYYEFVKLLKQNSMV